MPALSRRRGRDGGGARILPSGDQISGRDHRCEPRISRIQWNTQEPMGWPEAATASRLTAAGARARPARRYDVREREMTVIWLPGSALSTMERTSVSCSDYGHGDAMAGGAKLSGAVAMLARGGKRAWGERGKTTRLTRRSKRSLVGSGSTWKRRIRRWRLAAVRRRRARGRGFRASGVLWFGIQVRGSEAEFVG